VAAIAGEPQRLMVRLMHSDGSWRTFDSSTTPITYRGEPHVLIVNRDITDRKRAEDTLRDSERLFRLLAENMSDMVTLYDLDRNRVYVSPSCERSLGSLGPSFEGIHPDDRGAAGAIWFRVLAGERTLHTFRHASIHGGWRWLEAIGSLVEYKGKPHVLAVTRDITDRKHDALARERVEQHLAATQEQFRQAQKMEAIGRLAGGVAHDFNNLLQVINMYADLAYTATEPDDARREMLAEVRKAGQRAADLTRQLLAFSRKQMLQPRIISARTLVSDALKLLERLVGEDVDMRVGLDLGVGSVRVDPGQFGQALMNLVVNARDAMPRGGTIYIEATNGMSNDVVIRVRDTGCGMDAETQAKIFEPFFTTKEAGKGTGLGLAMVYGFVEQSGGHIAVESRPNEGAAFTISLPRVHVPVAEQPAPAQELEEPSGSETILLVEDDEGVRRLVRRVLESFGYSVLEARDPEHALRITREHAGPLHMLLSDLVMPRMSGHELARQVTELRPEVRTVFMSGYSETLATKQVPRSSLLQKPFTPEDLALKVRAALDGA
jgi:PAS domain S-box-containing protein